MSSVVSLLQPVITCKAGRVSGNRREDIPVLEFLGIPFAEPPVKLLRFQPPRLLTKLQPKKNGIFNATKRRAAPWQSTGSSYSDDREACWIPDEPLSEDCLHINIWTPCDSENASSSALPVLVWIYGGAFVSGSATLPLYDGGLMAFHGKVVVVSINYRLGPLGFLYAPNHNCHGNMGLWDQQCGLRWLANNVKSFGGDPENITLFGESAGSASITAHLLSPSSWPLFHRVILQSGVITNPWAVLPASEAMNISEKVIKSVDGWTNLMEIDPELLLELDTCDSLMTTTYQPRFVPVVDGEFLSEDPLSLLSRGAYKKCPIAIGCNQDEGAFIALGIFEDMGLDHENHDSLYLEQFEDLVQHFTPFIPRFPHALSTDCQKAIVREYYQSNSVNWDMHRQALVRLAGDFYILVDIEKWMKVISNSKQNPKIFSYYFKHDFQVDDHWPKWTGVNHGNEIFFLFGDPLRNTPFLKYTSEEKSLSSKMIKIWSSFAYSKDDADTNYINLESGSLEWNHWTEIERRYLCIDGESIQMQTIVKNERTFNFWDDLICKIKANLDVV